MNHKSKLLLAMVTLTSLLFNTPNPTHAATLKENTIILKLNSAYLLYSQSEMPYVTTEGRTMIPIRMISDLMGFSISWDNRDKSALIVTDRSTIRLKSNNSNAYVNDKLFILDTQAQYKNNTLMVPLRFLSDEWGISIEYKKEYNLVELKNEKLLSSTVFERINEMENLDDSFDGSIIPISSTYIDGNFQVKVKNYSDTNIGKSALHKNCYFVRPGNKKAVITATYGYTATPEGFTGINKEDLPSNKTYIDEMHIDLKKGVDGKGFSYVICNYFKTTHDH